jgi:hypothetical protein
MLLGLIFSISDRIGYRVPDPINPILIGISGYRLDRIGKSDASIGSASLLLVSLVFGLRDAVLGDVESIVRVYYRKVVHSEFEYNSCKHRSNFYQYA